ncbi:MAG TPA: glycosyltransferase family 2 protein [Holophagaceae bacterium]
MTSTPRPAVILVHYGGAEATRRCVSSLAEHEPFPHMVVVVDHGPDPGLAEALEGLHPDLEVLTAHDNPGFGAGCNRGARWALDQGASGLWFLNNDAVVEGPLLGELVDLADRFPQVALWAHTQRDHGKLIGADVQPAWYALPLPAYPPAPEGCRFLLPRESLSGASMFVTRESWSELGPWPEGYFLYCEDAAWCLRAHRLGRPLALLTRSLAHDRGTTTGRRSPLTVFYGVRNRLALHRELHPTASAQRLLMGLNLLQKRFFQFRWGLLGPTWKGLWAAARGRQGRDPRY